LANFHGPEVAAHQVREEGGDESALLSPLGLWEKLLELVYHQQQALGWGGLDARASRDADA
jgi:hypothetical protein